MKPEQFKLLRQRLGYSQRGIAKALTINYRSVQRYETGDLKPSSQVLKLLRYLEKYGDIDAN